MEYFTFAIIILIILTFSVVIVGVFKLTGNKKIDHKQQNKLMMLRVALQAVVVVLIGIVYYFSK